MSQFSNPISSSVRQGMTILPALAYSPEGDVIDYPDGMVSRYEDMKLMKRRTAVIFEDALDDRFDDHTRYAMRIVRMPNDNDLKVILDAARHLMLVGGYEVERDYKGGLSDIYEKNIVTVYYTCAMDKVQLDSECSISVPVVIPKDERCRIWISLFEAAGYRAEYGNVLNIRRARI